MASARTALSSGRGHGRVLGAFWRRRLADKRPYLTGGAIEDPRAHGTKRLLPHLSHHRLALLREHDIHACMAVMVDERDKGRIAAKTTNNARAALSSALADATRRGLLDRNPCVAVPPLPMAHVELDYLRLDEINRYIDACTTHFGSLAELLTGTGARGILAAIRASLVCAPGGSYRATNSPRHQSLNRAECLDQSDMP